MHLISSLCLQRSQPSRGLVPWKPSGLTPKEGDDGICIGADQSAVISTQR